MVDNPNPFLNDYASFAQQSWDAWVRHLQQSGGVSMPTAGFASTSSGDDMLARSLAGLSSYANWLQSAARGGFNQKDDSWQQQLQHFFGAAGQPFAQTFAGIDNPAAQGFGQQWQNWMHAMQQSGLTGSQASPMAPLGYTREQQLQQQAMAAAMTEYSQTTQRYHTLLQQVSAKGIARLQEKLAERSAPGRELESVKALYDLWVDAMEEAYAEIALSDEFKQAYGAMVNAQMQLRKLQQAQTQQFCRELGIPTRSEVDSLGKRLQELRRQWKGRDVSNKPGDDKTIADLEAEVVRLKRELGAKKAVGSVPSEAVKRPPPVARRSSPKAPASKSKAAAPAPRKRK